MFEAVTKVAKNAGKVASTIVSNAKADPFNTMSTILGVIGTVVSVASVVSEAKVNVSTESASTVKNEEVNADASNATQNVSVPKTDEKKENE